MSSRSITPLVTVITPTGDRQAAFSLCEKWMERQTFSDFQWVVVDDGKVPTEVTVPAILITRDHSPSGENTQGQNLELAVTQATGKYIAFVEDDDWYKEDYLETMILKINEGYDAVGEARAFFYNIRDRRYKRVKNFRHAALCQTVISRKMLPFLLKIIKDDKVLYDIGLWSLMCDFNYKTYLFPRAEKVAGIKGLPGRPGIGRGHFDTSQWDTDDENYSKLTDFIGEKDANIYMSVIQ